MHVSSINDPRTATLDNISRIKSKHISFFLYVCTTCPLQVSWAVHGAVRVARRLSAALHGGGAPRPGVHPPPLRRVPPAALRQAPIL